MPIAAFTRLCRELDIGERYKTYLEDNVGISNPVAAAVLQPKIRESQKAALTAALHMAQMQNLLDSDVHRLILGLIDGLPYLSLRGQPWRTHDLTIMNARVTGILLFAARKWKALATWPRSWHTSPTTPNIRSSNTLPLPPSPQSWASACATRITNNFSAALSTMPIADTSSRNLKNALRLLPGNRSSLAIHALPGEKARTRAPTSN
jgi:hypothetical protein